MISLKSYLVWLLVICGFVVTSCNKSQYPTKQVKSKNLTPRELLQAVKKRYHSYNKLEVSAHLNMSMDLSMGEKKMHHNMKNYMSVYYASKPPGKIRFVAGGPKNGRKTIVSDGNVVWHYVSQTNTYSEEKNIILPAGADYLDKVFKREFRLNNKKHPIIKNALRKFARAFNPLADSIQNITGLGQHRLTMPDSSKYKVSKIEVKYVPDNLSLSVIKK